MRGERMITCPECGQKFGTIAALESHVKREH